MAEDLNVNPKTGGYAGSVACYYEGSGQVAMAVFVTLLVTTTTVALFATLGFAPERYGYSAEAKLALRLTALGCLTVGVTLSIGFTALAVGLGAKGYSLQNLSKRGLENIGKNLPPPINDGQ